MRVIETITTISFKMREKKPQKRLRINVKMTKKCLIYFFAVSHVALDSGQKYSYTPCMSLFLLWIIQKTVA